MEICNRILYQINFLHPRSHLRQRATKAFKTMTHVIKVIHNLFNLTEILIIKKKKVKKNSKHNAILTNNNKYFLYHSICHPKTTTSKKSQEISHLFLYTFFIIFLTHILGNVGKIDCYFPSLEKMCVIENKKKYHILFFFIWFQF